MQGIGFSALHFLFPVHSSSVGHFLKVDLLIHGKLDSNIIWFGYLFLPTFHVEM